MCDLCLVVVVGEPVLREAVLLEGALDRVFAPLQLLVLVAPEEARVGPRREQYGLRLVVLVHDERARVAESAGDLRQGLDRLGVLALLVEAVDLALGVDDVGSA